MQWAKIIALENWPDLMAQAKKRRQIAGNDEPRKKPATATSDTSRRITRLMTTDASRKAVFATAELLENVFLSLPPKNVLGIQRTCRQFLDIVATSVKIQEHVFLRKASTDSQSWHVQSRDHHESAFARVVSTGSTPSSTDRIAKPVTLHPLLTPLYVHFGLQTPHSATQVVQPILRLKHRATSTSTGTWRLMYLTKPPVTTAKITLHFEIPNIVGGGTSCTVQDSNGLTLCGIIDAAIDQKCSARDFLAMKRGGKWVDESAKMKDRTLKQILIGLEDSIGSQAWLQIAYIDLEHAIVPTAEEWEQVLGAVKVSEGVDI